jgi:hypothetical protein
MNPYALAFWLPLYLVIGSAAYIADLRWGVGVRGFFVDLISDQPGVHTDGFLVGRGRRVQYFWSCIIAGTLATLMVATGVGAWLWEALIAVAGSFACLLGIQVGPAVILGLKGLGIVLDRMEKIESAIKEQGPQIVDDAIAKGKEVASAVMEKVTPDPNAPTDQEIRQDKIDRMDELLGNRRRERDRDSN